MVFYDAHLCEKETALMDDQWPPAPTNAKRMIMIGRLKMEFDGGALYCSQPYHETRQRRERRFTVVVSVGLLVLIVIGLGLIVGFDRLWIFGGRASLRNWLVLSQLLAPILFLVPSIALLAS